MKNKELMIIAIGVSSFTVDQLARAMRVPEPEVSRAVETAIGLDLVEGNGDGLYRVSEIGREETDIIIHDEMKEIIERIQSDHLSLMTSEDVMRLDFLTIGLMMNEYHKGTLTICPGCLKEGRTHFVHLDRTLSDIMDDDTEL